MPALTRAEQDGVGLATLLSHTNLDESATYRTPLIIVSAVIVVIRRHILPDIQQLVHIIGSQFHRRQPSLSR
jgi:hypothetical protein